MVKNVYGFHISPLNIFWQVQSLVSFRVYISLFSCLMGEFGSQEFRACYAVTRVQIFMS